MAFAARLLFYILGGGALLAWLHPSHGIWRIAAPLVWIGACAAMDMVLPLPETWQYGGKQLSGKGPAPLGGRKSKGPASPEVKGRRSSRVLFSTGDVAEAENLSGQLRDRGFHPMVVTQRGDPENAWSFEVRVQEPEFHKARALLNRISPKRVGS